MKERNKWIALLGRRDFPTDALRDYCSCLSRALEKDGVRLEQAEVPWAERGWWSALTWLSKESRSWQRTWVLLQYTALSWSRRGLPFGALAVIWILRRRGVRCVVVFHDSSAYGGKRLRDRMRRICQLWVMKSVYRFSTRIIFTEPLETISWMPAQRAKSVFIPVGANIPECLRSRQTDGQQASGPKTIAVFGITDGRAGVREVADIAYAVKQVKARGLNVRLVVLGRGSEDARQFLERAFNGSDLEIVIRGILPAEEVTRTLSGADALLFVRGEVSSRRGSALAGVACGLPIVSYGGARSFPVSEAGAQLVPPGNLDSLASALGRVLADEIFWSELHERSRWAHATYFSWEVIARQFRTVLENGHGRYRVLLICSHPVQYAAPQFRQMARHPKLDILVAYLSLRGAERGLDPDFGVEVKWDVPLLDGYVWIRVPDRSVPAGLKQLFTLLNPDLWKLIRTGGFDAVICFAGYNYSAFWITVFAARMQSTPLLFGTDAHEIVPRDGHNWKTPVTKWFWARLFRLADVVLAPSSGSFTMMRSLGIPEERLALTPYVVDNDWWLRQASSVDRKAIRAQWGIPADAPIALFCAKLQPWKRPQDLLSAFKEAGVAGSYLVFAGEGPLRSELESKARASGIDERVRFLGFVNQTSLPAVYRAADLLVLPSEYEPFGVVVNEAMLCECPVVVSDRVGARFDLVEQGKTGFIFPCGDVQALATILRNSLADCERLKQMGEAARERMARWNPEQNIEATIAAIERAIHRKSAAIASDS